MGRALLKDLTTVLNETIKTLDKPLREIVAMHSAKLKEATKDSADLQKRTAPKAKKQQ